MSQTQLTLNGFQALREELRFIQEEKLPELERRLGDVQEAWKMTDVLAEQSFYHDRVTKLNETLETARLIPTRTFEAQVLKSCTVAEILEELLARPTVRHFSSGTDSQLVEVPENAMVITIGGPDA